MSQAQFFICSWNPDDVIDNGTYIPDVILKEVKLFMLLTRLS